MIACAVRNAAGDQNATLLPNTAGLLELKPGTFVICHVGARYPVERNRLPALSSLSDTNDADALFAHCIWIRAPVVRMLGMRIRRGEANCFVSSLIDATPRLIAPTV